MYFKIVSLLLRGIVLFNKLFQILYVKYIKGKVKFCFYFCCYYIIGGKVVLVSRWLQILSIQVCLKERFRLVNRNSCLSVFIFVKSFCKWCYQVLVVFCGLELSVFQIIGLEIFGLFFSIVEVFLYKF